MEIHRFQIASADREVNILQFTNSFQFDDDLSFDEKIETMFADLMIAIK